MAATFEFGGEERGDDLFCESEAHHSFTHRQHVGVVVLASEPRRVEAATERSTYSSDLVRGKLLTLPGASEHDAEVGLTADDPAGCISAERRVVDGFGGVGTHIDHFVARRFEEADEVSLQLVPGMI